MNESETTDIKVSLARLEEQNKNIIKNQEEMLELCKTFVTKEACDLKQGKQWYKTLALVAGSGGSGGIAGYLTGLLF